MNRQIGDALLSGRPADPAPRIENSAAGAEERKRRNTKGRKARSTLLLRHKDLPPVIREAIEEGLLGRPVAISGTVLEGKQNQPGPIIAHDLLTGVYQTRSGRRVHYGFRFAGKGRIWVDGQPALLPRPWEIPLDERFKEVEIRALSDSEQKRWELIRKTQAILDEVSLRMKLRMEQADRGERSRQGGDLAHLADLKEGLQKASSWAHGVELWPEDPDGPFGQQLNGIQWELGRIQSWLRSSADREALSKNTGLQALDVSAGIEEAPELWAAGQLEKFLGLVSSTVFLGCVGPGRRRYLATHHDKRVLARLFPNRTPGSIRKDLVTEIDRVTGKMAGADPPRELERAYQLQGHLASRGVLSPLQVRLLNDVTRLLKDPDRFTLDTDQPSILAVEPYGRLTAPGVSSGRTTLVDLTLLQPALKIQMIFPGVNQAETVVGRIVESLDTALVCSLIFGQTFGNNPEDLRDAIARLRAAAIRKWPGQMPLFELMTLLVWMWHRLHESPNFTALIQDREYAGRAREAGLSPTAVPDLVKAVARTQGREEAKNPAEIVQLLIGIVRAMDSAWVANQTLHPSAVMVQLGFLGESSLTENELRQIIERTQRLLGIPAAGAEEGLEQVLRRVLETEGFNSDA